MYHRLYLAYVKDYIRDPTSQIFTYVFKGFYFLIWVIFVIHRLALNITVSSFLSSVCPLSFLSEGLFLI